MSRINLSEWALKHQQMIVFLLLLLSIAGVLAYGKLGQKEDPEFTVKTMVVQAYWPGSSAQQMAEQVTDKLEKKLQEVAEIDYTSSYSKPGVTQIKVNLREDDAAGRGAAGLVPGAQEARRHPAHAAAGRARPVLQRRVRRHLRQPVRDHRRRLRLRRAARLRRRGAQRVPARRRRQQGRARRRAGREDLRRGLQRQARVARHRPGADRLDARRRPTRSTRPARCRPRPSRCA